MSFVLFWALIIRYVCIDITKKYMISVPQALQIVEEKVKATSETITLSLREALGFKLAEDIVSPIDMPPFNQSAMDGYAVCNHQSNVYELIGEVQAGSSNHPVLKQGDSVRIFTGAPVPDTANAVIMQEKVSKLDHNQIQISDQPTPQKNIRLKGEQIQQGDIALKRGVTLNASIIGFLSGLGITKATVYKKPKVSIIVTGNELIKPGNSLVRGEIYESNAVMLEMALIENGFTDVRVLHVIDNYDSTKNTIEQAVKVSDFVLLTGGISVGDYDFVGKALAELKANQHFYKVKQKPGKPLYFGSIEQTYIYALPGNPAAALTSFYIYVLNSLCQYAQLPKKVSSIKAKLQEPYSKKGGRAQFLKAHLNSHGIAHVLTGQSSAMLRAFAEANTFVYVPEETEIIETNESVTLYNIPYA